MKRLFLALLAVLLAAAPAQAVVVYKYVTLTSDASGDASSTVDVNGNALWLEGTLVGVCIVPGADGLQPTDLFDIDINRTISGTSTTHDILEGDGSDLTNTAATCFTPHAIDIDDVADMLPVHSTRLTIVGANMGDSNTSTVELTIMLTE